jgi:hypothetical protein
MTIIEFLAFFPDEQSCRIDFKNHREKQGIICKNCSNTRHYWIKNKWQWQCSQCRFRTTLRSGTLMQSSKLSFHKWYLCMAFMSFTKKGISALEMQRQLGHKRYGTIWRLMHKLRKGMGLRDERYQLNDSIEFDEGYFEHATSKNTKLKQGRGSQRQANVAVMAESTPLENLQTGKTSSHCRYFKMKVLETHIKENANEIVAKYINEKAIIFSDKSTSYVDFSTLVDGHLTTKSDKETTKTTLKWVHIAISNAKRNLLGVYHMIKLKYLQAYLDEFCYKLNRRFFGFKLFERMRIASIKN